MVFEPKTPLEWRIILIQTIQSINPDFTDVAGSPQNLFVDEIVAAIMEMQDSVIASYSAFSAGIAPTETLENQGASVGLPRKTEQVSNVSLTFSGTSGVIIPEGTICTDITETIQVKTLEAVAIKSTGSVSVLAESENNEIIPPATIVQTIPTITGATVNNDNESFPGQEPESDQVYQRRILDSLRLNKIGNIPQAKAIVKSVDGVSSRLVSIRQIGDPATYSQVEFIVGGGDDVSVAFAIFNSIFLPNILVANPSPESPNSPVEQQLFDEPDTYDITFLRPYIVPLEVVVTYNLRDIVNTASFEESAQTSLAAYFNNLAVGEQLNLETLNTVVKFAAITELILVASDIKFLEFLIKYDGVPQIPNPGSNLIQVPFDGYFSITVADISFIKT